MGRRRENLQQTPRFAWSLSQGSISRLRDHDLSQIKNQTPNHPTNSVIQEPLAVSDKAKHTLSI